MAQLYPWLRFLHLVGLTAFLLGHGVSAGTSLAIRGRTADAVTRALLQISIRSSAVTYPGLLLILITGVWMGFAGSWWGRGWIWTAIALLVVTLVVMSALSVPYHRARDAASKNESDVGVESALRPSRPLALAVVGVLGLLSIIFLMVLKPF